jgi:hypothetical protein
VLGPPSVAALTLACTAVAALATAGIPERGHALLALAIAVGVVAAEAYPLHLAHGRQRHTFTFSEAPLVVGLVLSPGWLMVLAFSAGIAASQLWRRLPLPKVLFNVGQFSAAVACAVLFASTIGGPVGVVAGVFAFAVVNDLAVQIVLHATARRPFTLPLQGRAAPWFLHVACVTSAAILVGHAVETHGAYALALVAPVVLITYSKREVTRDRASHQVLLDVLAQSVAAYRGDRQAIATVLAASAHKVLAADVTQVLHLNDPGALLVLDGVGHGDQVREHRTPEDWRHRDEVLRSVMDQGADGVALGRAAGIVIGTRTAPQALLVVRRNADHEPFRNADLEALRVLADHGADWLADRDDLSLEVDLLRALDPGTPALL